MLHVEAAIASGARHDIEKRLTGKYYTPYCVSDRLAELSMVGDRIKSVCDPFCGDGRLIVSLIERSRSEDYLKTLKHIVLFDRDAVAVEEAENNVRNALRDVSRSDVTVESKVVDTFLLPITERYDLVITNPPWEQLKPDSRDQVADSSLYKDAIRDYSKVIADSFPSAATSKKRSVGGYNINLARAGAIAAIEMTEIGGQTLIVLPSTIFCDQVSTEFRNNFLSSVKVDSLEYYPAEAKLFKGVDQSFVTISAQRGKRTGPFSLTRYKSDLSILDQREHHVECLSDTIPLSIGGREQKLIQEIQSEHPHLSCLEKDPRYRLRLGREIDETRIAESFTESNRGIPFLKGRNVNRFSFVDDGLPRICPETKKIPRSVSYQRLVWRDVSRPSQKRRVQACILGPGIVTGNSLGVAYFCAQDPELLKALLAVVNSLVFEVQVRSILATNHISQGALRKCSVPHIAFEDVSVRSKLAYLVDTISSSGFSPEIEVEVAKSYGLNRDQFFELLAPFSKLEEREVNALMERTLWV
ncbi:type II restriction m6 adenine DNA methyltransferase, Alw26I/Eco31I/Esp3I family [Jannaschia faecimaris]|uniref:site-specific DNA-methyltransferase (adenine-specific) n=2 Tax=Jannaschia faecimaris TaxID=1244108 RepID=A0A1H3SJQ2_9RHOB|nr:type II restriction m6 adenine DNA methyltransferase, Alw26I/Eco31I/Esp3I family [Jannaschia faecimaris]